MSKDKNIHITNITTYINTNIMTKDITWHKILILISSGYIGQWYIAEIV